MREAVDALLLATQLAGVRKVMPEQQNDIAELGGQLKALIHIQARSAKRP